MFRLQLNIPTFNGNVQDWQSFKDLLKALIINNFDLTLVHILTEGRTPTFN